VDRPFESGIVVETADDGAGVVIVPPRGADPVRGTVFGVISVFVVAWLGLTLDPAVSAWSARVHAAGLGTRLFGLVQLVAMLGGWGALWWGWGNLLVTMFGEETIVIGPHEVTYARGAFGITRRRRWATNHISTFRYRPALRLNQWARSLGAEVRLYSSTGEISLVPGVTGLEARWLAAQLNELLAGQRPPQFTRAADGFD
jgi:hypothetical protein